MISYLNPPEIGLSFFRDVALASMSERAARIEENTRDLTSRHDKKEAELQVRNSVFNHFYPFFNMEQNGYLYVVGNISQLMILNYIEICNNKL